MKKGIFIFVVIGFVSIVAFSFLNGQPLPQKTTYQPTPVVALKVFSKSISDEVEALGTTLANESVDITSNVSEKITSFSFVEGDEVKKHDIIAMQEQLEEKAELDAKTELLIEHERELKRLENLIKSKAAAKRQYDERKTLFNITRNEINQIQAKVEDRLIRAPFDGVLGIRRVSVGTLVRPGDIITTIDDIRLIKLDFSVPSLYLAQLKRGGVIQATTDAYPDKVFKGEITTVNTRVDAATRSIQVRAFIDNKEKLLKPGLFMNVKLINRERLALMTAEQALVQLQKNHYVFTVDKTTKIVSKKLIKIGQRMDGLVEVLDGLETGEQVIISGVSQVKPGQTVSLKKVIDYINSPEQLLESL